MRDKKEKQRKEMIRREKKKNIGKERKYTKVKELWPRAVYLSCMKTTFKFQVAPNLKSTTIYNIIRQNPKSTKALLQIFHSRDVRLPTNHLCLKVVASISSPKLQPPSTKEATSSFHFPWGVCSVSLPYTHV